MAGMQVADVRKLIDGLRWDRRRHPYSGRREYSQRAQAVAAAVADMIEAGDAESAAPLARRAVERVTAALMYMDDSAGIVGDDLRTLMALYARACRAASPDAGRLARWLVSMQLDGPGWPAIELKEFAEALGPRGLAEVARLTEERGVTAEPDSWTAQWGIKDLREQLAAVSGDIDAHVAVLAEDLRGAHRYSEIMEVLRDAGRDDAAEQWARKGLAEHPSGPQTDRLRDQLVDLLLDGGRGADAVAVCREIYERRAIHQDYLKLRHAARQAGQWPDLSGWALNLLRDRAQADQRYVRELISVLVREDLLDEAWAAAMANPAQVPESQWFQLIEVREKDHPADVIRPYQDLIEIGLAKASDKYRYPKAIKTIRRLRDSYHRAGDEAGFTAYLADLRQRHRRKTSFLTKLDKSLVRR
jgi:tetratricopeptide (TPR) repeat protein